ncbi:3-isopropylmalate dehydratase small subunit [Actinacidiphila yeochonensis]|uniref:3-isopropylmalate dehydratase small subunit n=1 Tax=Actinacidiphila yeochonensis TaxID=89050 RepID=UPI00056934A4|nr:3-isopropylmalate dehydratase small subunit [Actinacidiphila yeochonensis]
MDPVTRVTGTAVPLDRSDVDTDQLIPAVWMKKTERTGFEDGLFQKWRRDPEFVLNQPERKDATILVSGPNFGCGSSREHAPWALRDYGFKVVVTPGFADIFRNNLPNTGLVPAWADPGTVRALLDATTADPTAEITVDVVARVIHCPAAGVADAPFFLDDAAHHRLVNGFDQIDLTLQLDDLIAAHESRRPDWLPTGTGVVAEAR